MNIEPSLSMPFCFRQRLGLQNEIWQTALEGHRLPDFSRGETPLASGPAELL